jgi:hypothetical protein
MLQETLSKWKVCQSEIREVSGKNPIDCTRAICKALEFVVDRVHKIRVDTINNKLLVIAPVVRTHGIEYLKKRFTDKVTNGTITMQHTEKWITHTVEQVLQQNNPVVDLNGIASSQNIIDLLAKFKGVMHAAFINLIAEYSNNTEIPGTMMLELVRVKALNACFHTDVLSAIILTQVYQVIPPL